MTQQIKEYFLKILKASAERLFLSCVVLIFISLIISSAVFYKYNILPQRIDPELGEVIKFDEKTYQRVLDEWKNRGDRFELAKTKKYSDLFK